MIIFCWRNEVPWKEEEEIYKDKYWLLSLSYFPWCTLLVLTFAVFVAERSLSHVTQAYWALAAAVGEGVTMLGMKLRWGDHLRQLLHVGRLDVHNVWETAAKEQLSDSYRGYLADSFTQCWEEQITDQSLLLTWADINNNRTRVRGYWSCDRWSPGSTGSLWGRPWRWTSAGQSWRRWSWCGRCGRCWTHAWLSPPPSSPSAAALAPIGERRVS